MTDGGIVVYDCVVCGHETVFNGMCLDCQCDAGRPLEDMAADWDNHIAALVADPDPGQGGKEQGNG